MRSRSGTSGGGCTDERGWCLPRPGGCREWAGSTDGPAPPDQRSRQREGSLRAPAPVVSSSPRSRAVRCPVSASPWSPLSAPRRSRRTVSLHRLPRLAGLGVAELSASPVSGLGVVELSALLVSASRRAVRVALAAVSRRPPGFGVLPVTGLCVFASPWSPGLPGLRRAELSAPRVSGFRASGRMRRPGLGSPGFSGVY